MKRVSFQGIVTRRDVIELIEIFERKGAQFVMLSFRGREFKVVAISDLHEILGNKDSGVTNFWLNTCPFEGQPRTGNDFPGSLGIGLDGSNVIDGYLTESTFGTFTPATGNQLKVWESGLRLWKKRLHRDVHMFSRIVNKAFPNEKLNVSQDAIEGYERGKWRLVAGSHILVHPVSANREVPFPM